MSETVEKTLLERRSVRRYEREPIAPDDLSFIRDAIRNAPTSYNGQQFSVIEITDPGVKEELAAITGQKQLKTAAVDFCFLSDFHKFRVAAEAKKIAAPPFWNTADGLIVGAVDASLAMMSAIVAAESRGLGCCPVGYARTSNPSAISKLLALPESVYLVCALAVGHPRETPDLKPKQPLDLVFFRERYGVPDMAEKLLAYDAEIIRYHETRATNRSDEDWIGKIAEYYGEGMGYEILAALRERGYAMEK